MVQRPMPEMVGAVDLGSNSFHMVIARVLDRDLHLVDRLRDRVQLASGLTSEGLLTDEVQDRALGCLVRFGQRLRDLPREHVRAVGTDALRRATNARAFLQRAEEALGMPIEIVGGREEARLIYLGVAHSLQHDEARRLVVDIGGGSTECILGEGFEVLEADSLPMGCVSFTQRFFKASGLNRDQFRKAELAARRELQSLERRFRGLGWEACVGASGTILAIDEVLRLAGWAERGTTLEGLRRLRKAFVEAGAVDRVELAGLKSDRAAVLPGGLAILIAMFESLEIEELTASSGAMREGLLYDLLGRIRHEDVRDRTIRRTLERYHVDIEQAARVERTALNCLKQVGETWGLAGPDARQLLIWAARLHEIGLAVSLGGYQRHGAYLIANSDMPGFSNDAQRLLAALVGAHRRKLQRETFDALPSATVERVLRLCLILRLAVLLNRARSPRPLPRFTLTAGKRTLIVEFPRGWLEAHPLTLADLDEEAEAVEDVGYALTVAAPAAKTGRRNKSEVG